MLAESEEHEIYMDAVNYILDMPYIYRTVLIQRFVLDAELKDIAKDLDIPIGTVKSRLNRGIKMLKEYFDVEK